MQMLKDSDAHQHEESERERERETEGGQDGGKSKHNSQGEKKRKSDRRGVFERERAMMSETSAQSAGLSWGSRPLV